VRVLSEEAVAEKDACPEVYEGQHVHIARLHKGIVVAERQ
jgi:hypothetical protein